MASKLAIAVMAALTIPAIGSADNLISNGSFETPTIPSGSWFYTDTVPNWTIKWLSDGTDGNLEFQKILQPTDGLQYVELATHGRSDSRVTIQQNVNSLCALDTYTLTFDHRLRESDDVLAVDVNGSAVSPIGNTPVVGTWNSYSVAIEPTGSSVSIEFSEVGPAGTIGSYLDNVVLTNDYFPDTACPELDAKPGSNPNGVNLCAGGGVTPFAFVGTELFDPNAYTIVGVFLQGLAGDGSFIVGKGKSDACKIEDVVDGTNPAEITPDGYDDVVCHVPTTELSTQVDASDISNVFATVCLTLNDGFDDLTVCADDQLKVARACE